MGYSGSMNTSNEHLGISGNKLRGNYLNIQDEWLKLHYLFRKANNILFERSAILATVGKSAVATSADASAADAPVDSSFRSAGCVTSSTTWKYVKFVSWEKSTSHPFIIFESSRFALLISLTLYGFIIGLWRVLRGDMAASAASRIFPSAGSAIGSAFMGSITRSFLFRLVSFILLLYFTSAWINDLQKESNFNSIFISYNILFGFKMFLYSEVMIFLSLFWAFIHFGVFTNAMVLMNYPPIGICTIMPSAIPLGNVLILL